MKVIAFLMVVAVSSLVSTPSLVRGAEFGFDISNDICNSIAGSESHWDCVGKKFDFAIVQAWRGGYGLTGKIDKCLHDAKRANMTAEIYVFMCPQCAGNEDPQTVIRKVGHAVNSSRGLLAERLWLDVEQCTGCWHTDKSSNGPYIKKAAEEARRLGFKVGVYSSPGEWPQTMGDYKGLSGYPLWYADYEQPPQPNFHDRAYHFGGWTKAYQKQYADHPTRTAHCGVSLDENWRP